MKVADHMDQYPKGGLAIHRAPRRSVKRTAHASSLFVTCATFAYLVCQAHADFMLRLFNGNVRVMEGAVLRVLIDVNLLVFGEGTTISLRAIGRDGGFGKTGATEKIAHRGACRFIGEQEIASMPMARSPSLPHDHTGAVDSANGKKETPPVQPKLALSWLRISHDGSSGSCSPFVESFKTI